MNLTTIQFFENNTELKQRKLFYLYRILENIIENIR